MKGHNPFSKVGETKIMGIGLRRDGKGLKGTRLATLHIRAVGIWNHLPEEAVETGTITMLERHLGSCMDRKGFRNIGQSSLTSHLDQVVPKEYTYNDFDMLAWPVALPEVRSLKQSSSYRVHTQD